MRVEVVVSPDIAEPKAVVYAPAITGEIQALIDRLGGRAGALAGYQGEKLVLLKPSDVIRVYAESQRVFAQTGAGVFSVRMRLYELEEKLEGEGFVRISNSEIISLDKIESLDLSIGCTICVNLQGGVRTFASRRYVSKLKAKLGI